MAEIPIAVMWDSRRGKLSVYPEFVTLYDDYDDTAVWVLLSDDRSVGLDAAKPVDFAPKQGPFKSLGLIPGDKKKCKGSALDKNPKGQTYKYTVRLSNGETLDPGIRRQPNP